MVSNLFHFSKTNPPNNAVADSGFLLRGCSGDITRESGAICWPFLSPSEASAFLPNASSTPSGQTNPGGGWQHYTQPSLVFAMHSGLMRLLRALFWLQLANMGKVA